MYHALSRESTTGANDAAPILLGEVVEVGGVEDDGAADDDLLEELVVLGPFSKDPVEGIKPVNRQKSEKKSYMGLKKEYF